MLRWTVSLPVVYPPKPLTQAPRGPLCRMSPVLFSGDVSGYTHWSTSLVAFDQFFLIDKHPREGYGAGPNIFTSDALALELSVFFFFRPLLEKLAPKHEPCSRRTLWKDPEGYDVLWTFLWCFSPVLLFYGCFLVRLYYLLFFFPLFGCIFSCWMTDQVQWTVQRTCHGLELKPISAVLQSLKLPIPPEVTVASGEQCY